MAIQKPSRYFPIMHLISLVWAGCGPNPLVWVLAAGPALMKLGLSIYTPDAKEFIHAATGKTVVRRLTDKLKGVSMHEPIAPGSRLANAWKLPAIADQAVWHYFIFGSIGDALIDWSSLIIKNSPCNSRQGRNWQSGFDPFGVWYANGQWWVPAAWQWENDYAFAPDPMEFEVPPYKAVTWGAAIQFIPSFGFAPDYQMVLMDLTTGEILVHVEVENSPTDEENWAIVHDAHIPLAPHRRHLGCRIKGGEDKPPPWPIMHPVGGFCYVAIADF